MLHYLKDALFVICMLDLFHSDDAFFVQYFDSIETEVVFTAD